MSYRPQQCADCKLRSEILDTQALMLAAYRTQVRRLILMLEVNAVAWTILATFLFLRNF